MSKLGIIMLVHTALHRAEAVARFWARAGCPVAIHVDSNVGDAAYDAFRKALADCEAVHLSPRHRCDWGGWGLVAATQDAAELLLRKDDDIQHIMLTSGACLPLRPAAELQAYLDRHPKTDFIESARTMDVPWTVDGLDQERFTLYFPFSWRRQRLLFDAFVELQRKLRVRRRLPKGIDPHMGSQWWCLSRKTLTSILRDPNRRKYERYFRRVWIPDESYFQTLTRLYSSKVESRSLTLSKFDFQGKPHIFYDDHLQLLRRSDCFVARKIWPQADALYEAFLTPQGTRKPGQDPAPGKIDRTFAKAVERRTRGRPGLYMQSRFPHAGWENSVTDTKYAVFHGFSDLFEDFETWLTRTTEAQVHGHLFAPARAEFADGQTVIAGALSDSAKLRDMNPRSFLTNLLWNTRGQRQCFQYGPQDNPKVNVHMARDPNALIAVISGAWAVPLFASDMPFEKKRKKAARLQQVETKMLAELRGPRVRARVRVWTMADFLEAPMEALQLVIEDFAPADPRRLTEAPRLRDLSGFAQFLQRLKNAGMHPYLTGDVPVDPLMPSADQAQPRPYLIRTDNAAKL